MYTHNLARCSGDRPEQLVDDLAVNVGQAVIAAGVVEGQFLVIETEAVQHGCLNIVHVDRAFDWMKTKIVGLANRLAALDATAGEPD